MIHQLGAVMGGGLAPGRRSQEEAGVEAPGRPRRRDPVGEIGQHTQIQEQPMIPAKIHQAQFAGGQGAAQELQVLHSGRIHRPAVAVPGQ